MTPHKPNKSRSEFLTLLRWHFVHEVCSGCQRQRVFAEPLLVGVYWRRERCPPAPAALRGTVTLPLRPVYCAACAPIDCNPPFSAFSSCFHFPKSIYEGNFGCGYLKERRASGLVFCENTTSVYRALFVSSPAFFLLTF